MKILSRRSLIKKNLRIAEMLQRHAERNHQPEAAQRYLDRANGIKRSLGASLGWITRSSRTY